MHTHLQSYGHGWRERGGDDLIVYVCEREREEGREGREGGRGRGRGRGRERERERKYINTYTSTALAFEMYLMDCWILAAY